ncbi:hypothetical protein EPA93_48030 [Ktedonosporobacter rubrisoli]|uniref:Alpha/beta hydrolase n=1 Tax=Ktedonosporobacter rubrisoli TaxID=2509675 RepID=A0A4P6K505_KTERU|nr:hypothetical protein [Ktedonosporobacter rubrisoli]QBD83304.1 hypothetical protein EPA93_48030 [Ktedonosporobacter rubrisoli]
MQLFASRYPDEVAALVLLDTGTADIIARTEQALGRELTQHLWRRGFEGEPEGMRFSDYLESCSQVGQAILPPVPTKVLSATLPLAAPPESAHIAQSIMEIMQQGHAALVSRMSLAEHILVERSSHYIHRDRPDIVSQVVKTFIEQQQLRS